MTADKTGTRVLITGGLGFIGSHAADAYLSAGADVTLVDSMVGAVIDGSSYEEHPRCRVVRSPVEEHLDGGGGLADIDLVVHAASHVGPAGILQHAGTLGRDIVASTSAVLEACRHADVAVCVFSSAEVYGRSGLLHEKDDIRVPVDYNARIEYAIAKTLTEAMALNSRRRGLRSTVVRPFNVAGSRQSRAGGFVMPTFVQQALAGRPLTVFGSGEQVRAFTAASDIARYLTDHLDDALATGVAVVNLGNPANETTILALAERVLELLGGDSPIVHVDGRSVYGDDYAEAESFVKAPVLDGATLLGWEPRVDLDELIRETADYYRVEADRRGADAPL